MKCLPKLFLFLFLFLFSFNLVSVFALKVNIPVAINYTAIATNYSATCGTADCWSTAEGVKCDVTDITYDEISGGDVNALGYTGYFNFIEGVVGALAIDGSPWYLSGADFELENNFSLGGFILSNLLPSPTLTRALGSGANRWAWLYVQNVSAENIDAYNLHLSENLTVDGFINGVNISNLSNQFTYYSDEIWINKNSTNAFNFNETKLSTIYYNATQSQAIAGTIDGGTLVDTNHQDGKYDGNTFNFSEVSATPGLDLRINFTGITTFNQGVMRYKTASGLAGVYPIIQMWNYNTLAWEDYPPVAQSITFATIEQPVFDSAEHVSGGVAQMRIYKATKGNTGNKYYIDWIAITKGFGTPSGEEVDPYSFHTGQDINNSGYNISADYFKGDGSLLTGISSSGVPIWLNNSKFLYINSSYPQNINLTGTQSAVNVNATNLITAVAGAGNNNSAGGGFVFTGGAGGSTDGASLAGRGGGFIVTTGAGGASASGPYGGNGGDIELITGTSLGIGGSYGNTYICKNGGKVSVGIMNITSLSELFTVAGNFNLFKNNKLILGNSTNSSSVYFDGSNMQINPANNGSGLLNIAGEMSITQSTLGTGYNNPNVFQVTGGTAKATDGNIGSHILLTAGSGNGLNVVGAGGNITLTAGTMSSQVTGAIGGAVNIFGGTALAVAIGKKGGDINILAGAGANGLASDGNGGDVFIDGGGNAGGTGTVGNIFLAKTGGRIMIGNTTTPAYPLEVYGSNSSSIITAWFEKNISATGYITRTSVFDTTKGDALSWIKNYTAYLDKEGNINHSAFYGYSTWNVTDYSRPVVVEKSWVNPKDGKIYYYNETTYPYQRIEQGVELGSEIDVLRQSTFELNERLTKLEGCWISVIGHCII